LFPLAWWWFVRGAWFILLLLFFLSFRYVIDAGRVKRKIYDLAKGTSKFEVGWISQSSGDQRAGRAGRTGPGHCYRLYSSAVFNDRFEKFEEPEVQRMPLEAVLLSMKTMGIDCVSRFPWPSPPPAFGLHAAVRTLTNLGAVVPKVRSVAAAAASSSGTADAETSLASIISEELTPLGRAMAKLPIHPSLARMLVLAAASSSSSSQASSSSSSSSLLDYAIAIVACLTIGQIFVMPADVPHSGSGNKKAAAGEGEEDIDGKQDDEEKEEAPGDAEKALLAEIEQEQQELAAKEEEEEARGDRVDIKTSEEARRRAKLKQMEEKEKAKRKELRAQAAACHARFRHPLSDALTMLMAVGAFSHALTHGSVTTGTTGSTKKVKIDEHAGMDFCRRNWLRMQLHKAVHAELLGAGGASSGEKDDDGHALPGGSREATVAAGGGDEGEVGAADEDQQDEEAATSQRRTTQAKASDCSSLLAPFRVTLTPFDAATGNLLRQLIASGQIERVAKRAPPMEASALFAQAGISGKITRQLVPYIACGGGILGPLFIHPLSACFDRNSSSSSSSAEDGGSSGSMPEYLCYSEVVHTSRAYMRGITSIDQASLHIAANGTPLLRYEAPLESPSPWYECNLLPPAGTPVPSNYKWVDRAMCFRVPVFGDRAWKLTPAPVPFPSGDEDTLLRLFARSLLEGQVAPAFKPFASYYSLPPAQITKKANQKRVVLLLEALKSPPMTSSLKAKLGASTVVVKDALTLAKVWRYSTPLYLKTEIKAWLPFEYQTKVDGLWPGIVESFVSRVPKELLEQRAVTGSGEAMEEDEDGE
jgi:Helicase associated domain (HA2)/Oligonucleotide/oligosaccharide-binding (OB)-fold